MTSCTPAGLCCAALLARYGFRVTVCESHYVLGGAAHGFEVKGHHFDAGPSFFAGLSGENCCGNSCLSSCTTSQCTYLTIPPATELHYLTRWEPSYQTGSQIVTQTEQTVFGGHKPMDCCKFTSCNISIQLVHVDQSHNRTKEHFCYHRRRQLFKSSEASAECHW